MWLHSYRLTNWIVTKKLMHFLRKQKCCFWHRGWHQNPCFFQLLVSNDRYDKVQDGQSQIFACWLYARPLRSIYWRKNGKKYAYFMFEALESVKVTWGRVFDIIHKSSIFIWKFTGHLQKLSPPVTLTLSRALNMEQAVFLLFFQR